jgi:hypothetical protein
MSALAEFWFGWLVAGPLMAVITVLILEILRPS